MQSKHCTHCPISPVLHKVYYFIYFWRSHIWWHSVYSQLCIQELLLAGWGWGVLGIWDTKDQTGTIQSWPCARHMCYRSDPILLFLVCVWVTLALFRVYSVVFRGPYSVPGNGIQFGHMLPCLAILSLQPN